MRISWATALVFAVILHAPPLAAQQTERSRVYVLVHGAWGSIASWLEVERFLNESGHRVYLASLSGLGDRAHLQDPSIGLETHISDVANLIAVRNLTNVYLVGASYGGMVITGVWDRLRDRIKHVVYLDAFVPGDGKAAGDYLVSEGGGALHAADLKAAANGFVSPRGARNQPNPPVQSVKTFIDALKLVNGPLPRDTRRTFIRAIGNEQTAPDPTFRQFAESVRADPSWKYVEIMTGHLVAAQDPAGLARILLALE